MTSWTIKKRGNQMNEWKMRNREYEESFMLVNLCTRTQSMKRNFPFVAFGMVCVCVCVFEAFHPLCMCWSAACAICSEHLHLECALHPIDGRAVGNVVYYYHHSTVESIERRAEYHAMTIEMESSTCVSYTEEAVRAMQCISMRSELIDSFDWDSPIDL